MAKGTTQIPTIDVTMVTVQAHGTDTTEYALDTASTIAVEPQFETQESVKLVIKGVLKAAKPEENTITGNTITLTDNVFNPELVLMLQGGTITYDDTDPTKIVKYEPPLAGTNQKGEIFTLVAYSSIYNAAQMLTGYEKITYPNCQGTPIALSSEDNVFRASEYTINSAPDQGEAPYTIEYVDSLPAVD